MLFKRTFPQGSGRMKILPGSSRPWQYNTWVLKTFSEQKCLRQRRHQNLLLRPDCSPINALNDLIQA